MKLKTRLQIITIVSIGVTLTVGLTLFSANRQMKKSHEISLTSDLVVKAVAELEIVGHDYLLYYEDRAMNQWVSKNKSLSELLNTMIRISPEEKSIWKKMHNEHERIKFIFSQLVTVHEKTQTLNQKAMDIYPELEERLTSQLLLRLQTMISGAFRFGEASHAALVTDQQRIDLLIIVFVGIMAAITSVILFLMSRSFVKPIVKLQEGARIIGTGNLDYKVGSAAADEIGQLSRAFDQMTEKLKTTMVSRDRLAEEIDERKEAEERNRHLKAVLQAIRSVNRLIVKEKDRDRLIKSVCHNLIATRGYFNAWIALFDKKGELVTTAEAGLGRDFLPMVEILKQGDLSDCGQKVLTQAGVNVIEDPPSTCTHCPLANKYTGRSGMRVRLKIGEKIYGMLTVSIPKKLAQDREEQSLFHEVADDIALALHSAEMEGMRKQAEKALQASEEKYRMLFEDSRDAIYITTRKGRLVDANPAFFDLFGCTREEIPLINARQLYVNPDDGHRFRKEIEQKGFVRDFGAKFKKNDGTEMDCLLNVVVQQADDGSIIGYQGIIHDVTEQKKLEEQLHQSQKMEAIGKLAGGVAHDFNNLLTTIMGYTDIMLMQVDQKSPLRSGMEEIKMASNRAATLTGQLLAFSRKQMIRPVVLNINHTIAEMDKMLRRLIGEDIDLATILEPELWKVKFDPGQMDQVLMNLAVNAKDAMPKGGKLTIETANVELYEVYARQHGMKLKPGPFVVLAVSDTGVGIDEKIRFNIFEPFFTTKEKGKGTGLGLSTVYGIVKQSDGYIWVYSEPSQGTMFKIYLPKSEEKEAFMVEAKTQPQNLEGSETILLAEDDDSARKLIRSSLQEFGYWVLEAQDGKEALQLIEHHKGSIHLLLTDVVMPGMSGRELAERLQPLQPKMKVLYMSGYTDNAIVHHGVLESGMQFIQKPFTPKVLISKVREVLDT